MSFLQSVFEFTHHDYDARIPQHAGPQG